MRSITITLALCAALVACSATSSPPAADNDAGNTDAGGAADTGTTPADAAAAADSASDAEDGSVTEAGAVDGGGCSGVTNDGPAVTATATLAAMPTAAGGTINPGRYHLTAWEFYGVAAGPSGTITTTMIVTATTLQYAADAGAGGAGSVAVSYTTNGTAITQVQTCRLPAIAQLPDGMATTGTYEATAARLKIFSATNGGISSVQTFDKQ
jgi:hypothetical protein